MRKYVGVLLFLTVFLVCAVSAQEIQNPTNKYVDDFAGVLNTGQQQELMNLFSSVDSETTAEMVFVSVSDLGGDDISQYAVELGQKWGVGKRDNDNGLVILYASDVRKIYVSTGYGLEGILPDSKVGRILDENYVPYRDAGNFSEGIVLASKAFAQVILDNKDEVLSGQASGGQKNYSFFALIAGFLLFIGIFVYFISARKKKKGFVDFWDFFFADFIARMVVGMILGGRGRNSGGGFSGGGGFGGGGFGGGGAGR